jgi:hypothetical protein
VFGAPGSRAPPAQTIRWQPGLRFAEFVRDNQTYAFIALMVMNQIGGQLMSTGAFEVRAPHGSSPRLASLRVPWRPQITVNGKQVFSKARWDSAVVVSRADARACADPDGPPARRQPHCAVCGYRRAEGV